VAEGDAAEGGEGVAADDVEEEAWWCWYFVLGPRVREMKESRMAKLTEDDQLEDQAQALLEGEPWSLVGG
jgi:hypothetical protein